MFTKCMPAGDLFPYMAAPMDMRGDDRDFAPHNPLGNPDQARELLESQVPSFLLKHDKLRRWVRFSRGRLTHLISCFSEDCVKVMAVLPQVMKCTQELFLAGLPRGSLCFVWYVHPEAASAHAHCGLVR